MNAQYAVQRTEKIPWLSLHMVIKFPYNCDTSNMGHRRPFCKHSHVLTQGCLFHKLTTETNRITSLTISRINGDVQNGLSFFSGFSLPVSLTHNTQRYALRKWFCTIFITEPALYQSMVCMRARWCTYVTMIDFDIWNKKREGLWPNVTMRLNCIPFDVLCNLSIFVQYKQEKQACRRHQKSLGHQSNLSYKLCR